MSQLSQSGRQVVLVAVSQGLVFVAQPGDTAWTPTINGTGRATPLNFTGVVYSSPLNQALYFADGVHRCYYTPVDNTVHNWVATAGSLPQDDQGNQSRLITTWRGRIVESGQLYDPQNWFMSAIGDATNWDYAPVDVTPTQAVAGNNSPMGLVGHPITGLCPFNDDTLLFFCSDQVYVANGDPMANGQIDRISDSIGAAWGIPWAKSPEGEVFFFSNRCGVYQMMFGQSFFRPQPQHISQQIFPQLQNVDTGSNTIRLAWDERYQGLHVFISPTAAPGATTHYFWERRAGAWWQSEFDNTNLNPLAVCAYDGNTVGDRAVLIGSWDGYVRTVSSNSASAPDDDGTPISSSVFLGPITSKNLDEFLLKDLQAVLGETSGTLTYSVYVGASAEVALSNGAVATGTWSGGRNLDTLIRRSGHAVWIKLSSTSAWSMEVIRARIAGTGKVRRRGA